MKYENIALKILQSLTQRWKVVAILVNKKPVAIASNNSRKTSPLTNSFNPRNRLHAELRCLKKASPEKLEGSTMYIWRMKQYSFGNSRPCSMCMKYLKEAGVKQVVYSTNTGFAEEEI